MITLFETVVPTDIYILGWNTYNAHSTLINILDDYTSFDIVQNNKYIKSPKSIGFISIVNEDELKEECKNILYDEYCDEPVEFFKYLMKYGVYLPKFVGKINFRVMHCEEYKVKHPEYDICYIPLESDVPGEEFTELENIDLMDAIVFSIRDRLKEKYPGKKMWFDWEIVLPDDAIVEKVDEKWLPDKYKDVDDLSDYLSD